MFEELYKLDSDPLERVTNVVIGEDYCNESGTTIRYIANDEIDIVRSSPLVDGELMENLTSMQLTLFWKLRRESGLLRG